MSGAAGDRQTYDPAFFDHLARIEERHAWFRVRNRVVADLVAQLGAGQSDGFRVLDVGCGAGAMLGAIERACPGATITGLDRLPEGLRHARTRTRADLVVGDAMRPPFRSAFDVIGMFDVLEHLPDDVAALRAQRQALAPGGRLMLTVPDDPALWSYFDVAARHVRRYTEASLTAALHDGGYRIEYLTPMMAALAPLLKGYRRFAAGRASMGRELAATTQDLQVIPGINGLMLQVLGREHGRIMRRERLS
ncbi:MAG: class I SAM-dependent methyltransferase, partial [Thermomicrobiales bacterium]